MKKLFLFIFIFTISAFLLWGNYSYSQQPNIEGIYKVGDTSKCNIKMTDDNKFFVFWFNSKDTSALEYKEDMDLTREHIWLEKMNGKVIANFIMHENYFSGHYVRFSDEYKAEVIREK